MIDELSDDEEYRTLLWFVDSPVWKSILRPAFETRLAALYVKLLDPSTKRKEMVPDDYIRGQLAVVQWLLTWPPKRAKTLQDAFRQFDLEQTGDVGASTAPH